MYLKLLNSPASEGVARSNQNRGVVPTQPVRDFAEVGALTDAVDSTEGDGVGTTCRGEGRGGGKWGGKKKGELVPCSFALERSRRMLTSFFGVRILRF